MNESEKYMRVVDEKDDGSYLLVEFKDCFYKEKKTKSKDDNTQVSGWLHAFKFVTLKNTSTVMAKY